LLNVNLVNSDLYFWEEDFGVVKCQFYDTAI